MYQFVAKSFDKTIISGVCFNQDVDIHVTTKESTIFTLGSVNISNWPLKSQSNNYIIYYRVLFTENLFIICI